MCKFHTKLNHGFWRPFNMKAGILVCISDLSVVCNVLVECQDEPIFGVVSSFDFAQVALPKRVF